MVPNTYNEGNQILQQPGVVVLRNEMIHEARVIPIDGRPHVNIRSWMGDSRGHWEGNTLVVETTNFIPQSSINNTPTSEALKLIERFTRIDANTLGYQVSRIDDHCKPGPFWTCLATSGAGRHHCSRCACRRQTAAANKRRIARR